MLLLSVDPLAALAETQEQPASARPDPVKDADLRAAWHAAAEKAARSPLSPWGRAGGVKGLDASPGAAGPSSLADQFYVILECRDEKHQVDLLARFTAEGFKCKAALTKTPDRLGA